MFLFALFFFASYKYLTLFQQIRALLQNVGTDMCPDPVDWLGTGTVSAHSRNADRSVLTKFLQARPADCPTTKLQV